MSTLQLQQSQDAWLEFILKDTSGDEIILVEASQIRIFYKRHGELQFTQLTGLTTVSDPTNPQAGENFVEIGFGVYAVKFTASQLDTLETFTWVVIPDDPDALDFKQWTQQFDVVIDSDYSATLSSIKGTIESTATDITSGFDDTTVDVATVQTTVNDIKTALASVQTIVESIEDTQPSGISVSFVE